MTQIAEGRRVATLINVFTVLPAHQRALADALARATSETIRHMPGFISANIHTSIDGTRVTNYAQWRSREDLEAMLRDSTALPHLEEAKALATSFDAHLYEVSAVHSTRRLPRRVAAGAAALGALAVGAFAVGAMAIGRLGIGSLSLRRAAVRSISFDEVDIGRLRISNVAVDQGSAVLPASAARS
jgi:hypothetical protein